MRETTNTDAVLTAGKRLKKDGTPDRRGGKLGNKGNRQATGKKRIEGYETRKHYAFVATDEEYNLLRRFNTILRTSPDVAAQIVVKLGTPPEGRAKKDSSRKNRAIAGTETERAQLKTMLAIIKDRYSISYDVISNAEGL
jgi:hypothetical protein